MKIARWIVRLLSGDDGYPLSCDEWLAERITAQRGVRHVALCSARRHNGRM